MRDLLDIASKGQALPPINTSATDDDFAVFISNRPCGDKVIDLAKKAGDPRTLFWTPAPLTAAEKDRLLNFAAYRELVKDHQHKDTEDAKEIIQWVAGRLRDEIGSTAKIVTDSYARGQICATDHSNLSFNCQGELVAILSPLVGQVLDAVYESAKIEFEAPALFNDNEAIKVINGIVKTGDILKGTKPNQYTSAADNYGYSLGIMKKDGTKSLNTKGNEFVEDLDKWIDRLVSQGNATISLESVCKNFTGMGGPNKKNYGLSRRMIDIYLLCLVRDGKIRILLSGKGASQVEQIDYTNIAEMTFNAALLNSMTKLQKLKAPEGWPVWPRMRRSCWVTIPSRRSQKDHDIHAALHRLEQWRQESLLNLQALQERLDGLMTDIHQTNPVSGTLASWNTFLSAKIDQTQAIAHLLNALDHAFGYTCYAQNEVQQTELDDLASRKRTWEKAEAFCRHDQRIRAACRYSELEIGRDSVLSNLRSKIQGLGKTLGKVTELMESEAKLQSQLLEPLSDIQQVYRTRYLQAYDEVTGKSEQVRAEIDLLPKSPEYQSVEELSRIEALGGRDSPGLKDEVARFKEGLFETKLDRTVVKRALKERPIPENCPLQVDEAESLVANAEAALKLAKGVVRSALVGMAKLLRQPALRVLLEQGEAEAFIAQVLRSPDEEALADCLAKLIPADPANARLLAKYLKRLIKKTLLLRDFKPSKVTLEKADIETVVGEFRRFLEEAVNGDGKNQSTILEIK